MQGPTYTKSELKDMGISFGEEFYEDDTIESMKEELRT